MPVSGTKKVTVSFLCRFLVGEATEEEVKAAATAHVEEQKARKCLPVVEEQLAEELRRTENLTAVAETLQEQLADAKAWAIGYDADYQRTCKALVQQKSAWTEVAATLRSAVGLTGWRQRKERRRLVREADQMLAKLTRPPADDQ